MKKVFTLVLAMAIVITGFAQVKSLRKAKPEPVQKVTFTGLEERDYADFPASNRDNMVNFSEEELSYTTYDWQTNAASRNFTAVWPDGFAVMCYTQATTTDYSDRGTGLAIFDPAVGEWEYTESRVEGVKTGFGSISRWKENGLVVAAHTATECKLFFCEDFRNGSRDFSEVVTLPNELEPTWPCVQCSGANLDIVHVIASQYTSTDPFENALRYYRYQNGNFTANAVLLTPLNAVNMGGGGSNITCFLPYDPARPDRVSFVVNDAWVDGKVVISEDNGESWGERVFYQHPGVHTDFTDVSFHYPRWSAAQYDADDNLNVVFEWNGSTGEPGSGSYYPTVGGVSFWSETLPKSELAVGGIGSVGNPFVMDTCYLNTDMYYSEWYWSNAIHDPLPEYFGELQIVDRDGAVVPYDGELPEVYYWVDLEAKDHGEYNSGIAAFPSFVMDGNNIYAFWSMIAGDCATKYYDATHSLAHYRIFEATSRDGGRTWNTPIHVIDDRGDGIMHQFDEMVYGQVIPYIYNDAQGRYLWYLYQNDTEAGTYVMNADYDATDNLYLAIKVYIDDILGVDENEAVVPATTKMQVYPNPANGSFTMELSNEADVNIFNAVGQLVKSYKSVKNLNVTLEAGIYFVQSGNQTKKVVVL